jgi:hypothetical protein
MGSPFIALAASLILNFGRNYHILTVGMRLAPISAVGIGLAWWTSRLAEKDLARMRRKEMDDTNEGLTRTARDISEAGLAFHAFVLAVWLYGFLFCPWIDPHNLK